MSDAGLGGLRASANPARDGGLRIIRLLEQRRWMASALLIAIAAGCFAATLGVSGPQLSWDSQDYAQCARQVARGDGFTSKLLVGELTDGATRNGDLAGAWSNVLRAPLPVYAIAASFRLFGEADRTVCYWAGLFYVATCWLILIAFSPMFGFNTAFLSAIVFSVSRCGLMYAGAGLTESAAMFFLLLAFALLQNKLNFSRGLLIGIVFGVSSLNRPIALVWALGVAPVILLYEKSAGRRLAALGGVAAGVAAILLLSRFALHRTSGHTAVAINLAYGVGDQNQAFAAPVGFVLNNPIPFARKFVWQLARPVVYLFRFGDIPIMSGIAPFGLLICPNERQRRGRTILLAMLVSNTLVLSALKSGDAFVGPLRYFDVFAPLALPWAVQLLLRFSTELSSGLKEGFWCLLTLALLGSAYQAIRNPFPVALHPEVYAYLRSAVAQDEAVAVSEAARPPAVAWYADRRTVMLEPDAPQGILKLRQKGLRIHWFLTMQDEQPPVGFQVAQTWRTGFTLWHSAASPTN